MLRFGRWIPLMLFERGIYRVVTVDRLGSEMPERTAVV